MWTRLTRPRGQRLESSPILTTPYPSHFISLAQCEHDCLSPSGGAGQPPLIPNYRKFPDSEETATGYRIFYRAGFDHHFDFGVILSSATIVPPPSRRRKPTALTTAIDWYSAASLTLPQGYQSQALTPTTRDRAHHIYCSRLFQGPWTQGADRHSLALPPGRATNPSSSQYPLMNRQFHRWMDARRLTPVNHNLLDQTQLNALRPSYATKMLPHNRHKNNNRGKGE